MKTENRKFSQNTLSAGSALILTVVLTALLAVVGVVFVMMARVDKIATSAISENRELNFAVETIIAKISQELASDVPHNDPCRPRQEYYDYPDANNAWLASLEPYLFDGTDPDPNMHVYKWRQISDVTGYLSGKVATQHVDVDPPGNREVMLEYPEIELDVAGELKAGNPDDGELDNEFRGQLADTDGDGIADSKWVELKDLTSSKGKPIYAAIRVVDNSGMVNANTAYKFDPCDLDATHIDGSSQMQINLDGLAKPGDDVGWIHQVRSGLGDANWIPFQSNMVWRIQDPCGGYLPFDISDELEMRYRYCIDSKAITRLENNWEQTVDSYGLPGSLYDASSDWGLSDWQNRIAIPQGLQYDRRHLLTTYNIDRIIDPNGGKMFNIDIDPCDLDIISGGLETKSRNKAVELYNQLIKCIDPNLPNPARARMKDEFAQLSVNIVDFHDMDTDVTLWRDPNDPNHIAFYGFEAQPFITEIAMKSKPGSIYCAVELYNPFDEAIDLSDFEIELIYEEPNSTGGVLTVSFRGGDIIDPNRYFVVANNLGAFRIWNRFEDRRQHRRLRFFGYWQPPGGRKPPVVPGPDRKPPTLTTRPVGDGIVFLKRRVGAGERIYVDRQVVDPNWVPIKDERYFGRYERNWHVVYQTMELVPPSLGTINNIGLGSFTSRGHNFSFFLPNPIRPRAKFITVGDIPRILTIGPGITPNSTIGQQLMWTRINEENRIRLDLQNPYHRNVFQYLTVFDPTSDNIDNDGDGTGVGAIDSDELKIPGRININTAPWFVIAQLPWVSPHTPNYELARAIVNHRDMVGGFGSIGELNFVGISDPNNALRSIDYYARTDGQVGDLLGFPDLTFGDGIPDDFEERDIIFSRISNLVTVRSDVFTAYILVRIGADGPQKRVIAILDRSNVYSGSDKVRTVALHYVPDPR